MGRRGARQAHVPNASPGRVGGRGRGCGRGRRTPATEAATGGRTLKAAHSDPDRYAPAATRSRHDSAVAPPFAREATDGSMHGMDDSCIDEASLAEYNALNGSELTVDDAIELGLAETLMTSSSKAWDASMVVASSDHTGASSSGTTICSCNVCFCTSDHDS